MKSKNLTNRRKFLKGSTATAASTLLAPAVWTSAARADMQRLIVGGSGGAIDDVYQEAYYQPYYEATGIQVIPVTRRENPLAATRAIVETGTYQWDMGEGIAQDVATTLGAGGYLEPLDLSGPISDVSDAMKTEHFVSATTGAFILAYNTKKYDNPISYADMWDVDQFPGRRGLRKSARESVSVALVADGVHPGEISSVLSDEAGWARAFAKLDEIKDDIAVWWSSAAQTPTLLQTGEVDICTTFNGRAQTVIDTGSPIAITWEGSTYNNYGWMIPKGSPKADMAREFIKFCVQPERQAVAATLYGGGPSNPNSFNFIDPERAKIMPTHPDNIKGMAQLDFRFWGPIQEEATIRFNDWIQS